MKVVDFGSTDSKMYFIPLDQLSETRDTNDFINKYRNFYIDDTSFLKIFSDELIGEKTQRQRSNCRYAFQLVQDSIMKFGGILDIRNGIILTSDFYHFDLNRFNQHKDKFKRLDSYEINCYSIKQTKTLLKAFENHGGLISGYSRLVDKSFHNYYGRTKVMMEPIQIKFDESLDSRDLIKKKLDIDDIEIMSFLMGENDSLEVQVLSVSDFSDNLPKEIKVIESYTDSIDLPFNVYDLEKSVIDMIIQKNSINDYKLTDLNKKTTGNTILKKIQFIK